MKHKIEHLVTQAINKLKSDGVLDASVSPSIQVTRTKDATHGDFACNVAMMLAKAAGRPPRELAGAICQAMPEDDQLLKTEIAGPGFINFSCLPTPRRM